MGGIGGVGTPEGTAPGIGVGGPGGMGGYNFDDEGFITLSNPNVDSNAINAALDEAFGEVDALEGDLNSVGGGLGAVVRGIAGVITGMFTGSISAVKGMDALVKRGLTALEVNKALANLESHAAKLNNADEHTGGMASLESVAKSAAVGLVNNSGGPQKIKERATKVKYASEKGNKNSGGSNTEVDDSRPLGPKGRPGGDFWEQYIYEWQGAQDDLQKSQDFKQEKLAPVFDTYQKRLSGLSDEPTFKPISVGMGNFKTSFMPQRGMQAADKLLGSELAETDVMNPNNARLQYLDKLEKLALFKKEVDSNKGGNSQRYPDDQGTWLDAIGDIMKIGSSGADIYSKLSG